MLPLVLVLPVLAGCGAHSTRESVVAPSQSGDHAWTPGGDASAGAATSESARLLERFGPPPLDAYQWSASDGETLSRAYTIELEKCMREHGLEVNNEPPPAPRTVREPPVHWSEYLHLVDPNRAKTTAYQVDNPRDPGVDDRVTSEEVVNSEEVVSGEADASGQADTTRGPDGPDPLASLSADERSYADAASACHAQPSVIEPTDPNIDYELLGKLYAESVVRSKADPTVVAARAAWSTCMAASGYQLTEFPHIDSTANVTPEQTAKATADVACKNSAGVIDNYITVLYATERAVAAENTAALDAFVAEGEERVRRAAAALGQ